MSSVEFEPQTHTFAPEDIPSDNIDVLTQVPNRRLFQGRIERLQDNYAGHYGLITLDVNDLKKANDQGGGHSAGDVLLTTVVDTIRENVRSGVREGDVDTRRETGVDDHDFDVLFTGRTYRVGGDEFQIILAGAKSDEDVQVVIDRLRAAFAEKGVSASMGGRASRPDESTSRLLSDCDDLCMDDKKRQKFDDYRERIRQAPMRKRVAHRLEKLLRKYAGIDMPGIR